MRIQSTTDLVNLKELPEVLSFLSPLLQEISKVVNGNLSLSDNVKPYIVDAVFTAANAQISVAHTLGYVPAGYLVCGASVAMSVYDGATEKDTKRIYLKSTAAGTAKVWIF